MVSEAGNGKWERFTPAFSNCEMRNNQEQTEPVGQLWSKKTVARRFAYNERTINDWMKNGWLPFVKIGKSVRFIPADVEAFIRSRRIGGANEKSI
jgi:excisionase family DNA binding protein